jgi:hypothetical protein
MLWRPVTAGEEAFLVVYATAGRHVAIEMPHHLAPDFLVSTALFTEFTRLVATLELFLRSLRSAIFLYDTLSILDPREFGKRISRQDDLPRELYADRRFCELIKRAAGISARAKPCPPSMARRVLESAAACYICGVVLTGRSSARSHPTIDHLWPLSLGGESVEGNLISACRDCNEKRKLSITWAWGPVQSTYYRHISGISPPTDLRLSLGMARLMAEASGRWREQHKLLTLKEAANNIAPLCPAFQFADDRHRVYFELLQHVGVTA